MKLDKNKPFGTVHGGINGASFEQDGVIFDAQGEPLIEVGTEATETPLKPRKHEPDKPA